MTVLPGGQKIVAVITRLPYYGGGRKAGFHCKRTASTSVSPIRTARKILNANIYYFYPPPAPHHTPQSSIYKETTQYPIRN